MPFKSEAQRRFLWANHPDIAQEFADATPKGTKLPAHVKKAFLEGFINGLERFGYKHAAEEIRLKLPKREFHGFDQAFRNVTKKAEDAPIIEGLIQGLEQIDGVPAGSQDSNAADPLEKTPLWSAPTNPETGTTAARMSGVNPAQDVSIAF